MKAMETILICLALPFLLVALVIFWILTAVIDPHPEDNR